MERTSVEAFYRRYIDRCNAHDFASLGEFVADAVVVNDEAQGLEGYIAGLTDIGRAFPDFHWELRHVLVDGPFVAAHFTNTGTARANGRTVRVQELALYRLENGKIAQSWGDLDLAQLTR